MNLRLLLLLFCLAFAFILPAASWYVDNAATGENDGTSWSNAWTNPTNIIWASVSAGDTVFVSGGSTTKLYVDSLVIGKDGTAGSPVTVRIGQDAGHNGIAIFSNATIHPNGSRPKWNVIDGGRDPTFVAPTNHRQVALDLNGNVQSTTITNNTGFWIKDAYGTNNSVTSPSVWFLRNPDNCAFRWIKITGMTNTGTYPFASTRGTVCYLDGGDEGANSPTNNVWEYLFLQYNMGQQFAFPAVYATNFGNLKFRLSWLDNCGEDHFEGSGGADIHDNVLGPAFPNGVHCDIFQINGNFNRIYNNDVRESLNGGLRLQTHVDGLRHDFYFFNNLITERPGRSVGGGLLTEPVCFVHETSTEDVAVHLTTYSNIVFANNLFYLSISNIVAGVEGNPQLCRSPSIYWTKGQYATNANVVASIFANNIFADRHKGITMPVSTNLGAINPTTGLFTGFYPHTTNELWMDFNIHAVSVGYLENPTWLSYMDTFTNLDQHPFKLNSKTNYPVWVSKANYDFDLSDSDTAARNSGFDLSAYAQYAPAITNDALNRPRNVGGSWDIGPFEAQANLLVWLTFEDDFTLQPYITDQSGSGNHAYRFGYTNSAAGSNFPNRVTAALTPGTNTSTYAGEFAWYADGHGEYGRSGDYAAITNGPAFTNLTTATIAVRARYYASYNDDYTEDANAVLLSAGDAVNTRLGSWNFGRWNQSIFLNETRFIVSTNSNQGMAQSGSESSRWFGKAGRLVGRFNDAWAPINDGDTTNWHHYAVTWDYGVIKLYYDGVAIGTNDVSAVITNLNVGAGWIAVGANTHVGTNPFLDDLDPPPLPNNGFLNGVIDDVRIYNVALSAEDVQTLSAITAASTRRIMRVVGSVRTGTLTIQGN